jgi:ABC-type transport system involved in multi-copper enzyme maturation permease subunit
MNAQPLRALIWKDMRLNRTALILCGVLFALALLVWFGVGIYLQHTVAGEHSFGLFVEMSLMLVGGFTFLATALVGANVAAGEYPDRSADFLAYLPPSRKLVLLSKVIAGLASSLVLAAIGLAAITILGKGDIAQNTMLVLSAYWLIFAASWSVGAVSRSGPIGMCVGMSFPVALAIAIGNMVEDKPLRLFSLAAAIIGAILFVAATVILLRRREP